MSRDWRKEVSCRPSAAYSFCKVAGSEMEVDSILVGDDEDGGAL